MESLIGYESEPLDCWTCDPNKVHEPSQCLANDPAKLKFEALTVASLSQIVTEEVLEIDKQLIIDSKAKGDVSGSTALIALRIVSQNKLIVANVGDSRGVICDVKGATIPLSFDHKPNQVFFKSKSFEFQ